MEQVIESLNLIASKFVTDCDIPSVAQELADLISEHLLKTSNLLVFLASRSENKLIYYYVLLEALNILVFNEYNFVTLELCRIFWTLDRNLTTAKLLDVNSNDIRKTIKNTYKIYDYIFSLTNLQNCIFEIFAKSKELLLDKTTSIKHFFDNSCLIVQVKSKFSGLQIFKYKYNQISDQSEKFYTLRSKRQLLELEKYLKPNKSARNTLSNR